MRVLSLFSGGGLGDWGLELAGFELVGQVELLDYQHEILKLRWPNVPKWRDIKNVRTEELPKCDVVCGGFPCTDISIANNDPEGIAGERSGLWSEQFRIIRDLRPIYAIVENVSAILTRGMGKVIGDLASIGFDAEWQVIPSSWCGAFHRRERVWILAYPQSKRWEAIAFQGIFDPKDIPQKPKEWKRFQSYTPGADYRIERWKEIEDIVCGNDDGDANQVDRLHILGNGQQPQIMYWIGKQIMEFENQRSRYANKISC